MKTCALFCLILAVIICSLTMLADSAPIPPEHELRQHFPSLSNNDFAEMTNLLDQIKQAAHDKFYGKDEVVERAQHSTDMRQPSVSISIAQPGVQVPISRYLFEGDILLSPLQANVILRNLLRVLRKHRRRRSEWPSLKQLISSSILGIRAKRNLYSSEKARWKNFPIQYTFHDSLSVDAITEIGKAINYWMNHTCLTFEKVTEPERDYIEFFRGQGCYSMIGRVGGRQGVSIGDGCERTGTIEHEIGHALGLWHEQSRPDADCCILLEPENIISSFISDFLQRSWEEVVTYGIPYDLGSVMHYGSTAFTNDWSKKTVLTRDARYQRTIGQRERLSFYDVQVINKAYCAKRCSTELPCLNGGYTHTGTCATCICPDGIGGTICDRNEQALNAQCGGVLPALEGWAEITSPGYPNPGYKIDQKCNWILRAPQGKRVELQFIGKFQFFCTTTCLDFVEIKASSDMKNTGFRYCCFERPSDVVVSELTDMIVIFRSTVSRDVGFKARFRYTTELPTTVPPVEGELMKTPFENTTTSSTTTTTASVVQWSTWGDWSECSRTCGGCGMQSRTRRCLSSNTCEGPRQEFQNCNFDVCPGEQECTRIGFSDELCTPLGTAVCSKAVEVTFRCNKQPSCCPPFKVEQGGKCVSGVEADDKKSLGGTWSAWSEWSECIGPMCGGCAVQASQRYCTDGGCDGNDTQFRRCRLDACRNCRDGEPDDAVLNKNGTCDASALCDVIKQQLSQLQFACPCCSDLTERDGQCLPFVDRLA